MGRLLIATHNQAKLDDYQKIFAEVKLGVKVVSLDDLGIRQDMPEPYETFEENARAKAMGFYGLAGMPTLADDSGLEISYLNGAPGVHSRRWIGHKMTDQEMIDTALRKLQGVPWAQRTARLTQVAALVLESGDVKIARHAIEGYITEHARSDFPAGYPYRAIFHVSEYDKHLLDLTQVEYAQINHRRKTIQALSALI